MSKENITLETTFTLVDYINIVDAIVDGYFDINGEYQPHIGLANVMRLFYNNCVVNSKFDTEIPHDFSDIILVDKLASDSDFIWQFNGALVTNGYSFSFGNAFRDAQDIIKTKRSSITYVIDAIKNVLLSTLTSISDVMTQDNIDAAIRIANDVTAGKIDYTKLMAEFANSPEFQQIITSKIKDTPTDTSAQNNVVPFESQAKGSD